MTIPLSKCSVPTGSAEPSETTCNRRLDGLSLLTPASAAASLGAAGRPPAAQPAGRWQPCAPAPSRLSLRRLILPRAQRHLLWRAGPPSRRARDAVHPVRDESAGYSARARLCSPSSFSQLRLPRPLRHSVRPKWRYFTAAWRHRTSSGRRVEAVRVHGAACTLPLGALLKPDAA